MGHSLLFFLSFLVSMTLRKAVYWSRTGSVGILPPNATKQATRLKKTNYPFTLQKNYRPLILPISCSVYQHFILSFLGFEMG